ncbi:unnamed protein product [Mytilus coruscus]|uniref:TIR domain-containing protein n=1 Tax=Mytilus coruscus TaxID=42192 RepID=A0A6J8AD18_MYTCO|nr:unnamed protein product [Mytilus coruscus]
MPLLIFLRVETLISTGLYVTAWSEMIRFPEHNLNTVVWNEAYLRKEKGNRLFEVLKSVESLDISRNNIWRNVWKSRYIILLITPEFKSSRDCLFELDRAKYERVTRNLDKIIVITKDIRITDIPLKFSYIWNYVYLVQWPNDQGDLDDTWRRLRILFTDGSEANKQVTL